MLASARRLVNHLLFDRGGNRIIELRRSGVIFLGIEPSEKRKRAQKFPFSSFQIKECTFWNRVRKFWS